MKKNLLILSLLSLSLAGCGKASQPTITPSSPSVSEQPSISNKDTTSVAPSVSQGSGLEFEPSKTVTSLFSYLDKQAREVENQNGVSYHRDYYSYELGYFANHKVTEKSEDGEAFSNHALFVSGNEKKTTSYDHKDDKDIEEDTYLSLNQMEGNIYYSILDYGKGKEKDKASKTTVGNSNQATYQKKTNLNALDSLYSFYSSKISKNIIAGVDDIEPKIENNQVNYHLAQGWEEQIGNYKYKFAAVIDLTLDHKGRLTDYSYDFQEYQPETDENGNATGKLVLLSETKDQVSITFGTKRSYSYTSLKEEGKEAINPLDYFRRDYTPVLYSWDGVGTEKTKEDSLSFPVNRYVEAQAESLVPEKALDSKLTITKSTNNSVVSVAPSGVVKAIGVGETKLTIVSETGIEKEVSVKVVSPKLTSIKANTYSSYHYKGDSETLYITKTPDNSLDEIEVVSLTEEIIEVVKDDDGYYSLHNIGLGQGIVEVRSKADPSVKTTVSYLVEEKKTIEEVKANVVGSWVGDAPSYNNSTRVKDAFTVSYKADGTGTLTLNKEGTGYTFIVGKAYDFTYTFLANGSFQDRPVSLTRSTIVLDHGSIIWTYSNNNADFYYNGKNADISFATGNSEEFGAMVQLKATRIS